MTNREILEGNKLIAEFMGFEKNGNIYTNKPRSYPSSLFLYKGLNNKVMEDDLRFHSSWDWLMPVVRKIWREYHAFYEENLMCLIPKIDCWYRVIVEFVKSYYKYKEKKYVHVKDECLKCQTYTKNPKHGYYKCAVKGTCPGIDN